jgi:serine protease Do
MKRILSLAVLLCLSLNTYAEVNMGQLKTTFAPVVKQTTDSVVNIFTEKVIKRGQHSPFGRDPFFQGFFNDFFTAPMRSRVEKSLGSGVVVTPQGHVVTNYHVIDGADAIKVVFNDAREISAKLINADKRLDIAVLALELEKNETIPHLTFGDSDTLEVGDIILAIGNPYGVGQSVSMGIISALGRSNLGVNQFENFIQTDAAINPGNSGGAMVDSRGYLIGINTAIFTKNGGDMGIGFATPSNAVKAIVESILTTGKVVKPWLGATGQNLTPDLSEHLGLRTPTGVLINEIAHGSPAQKAGLKIGDIILEMDNHKISNTSTLNSRIAMATMTDESKLKIKRNGTNKNLFIQFESLPERNPKDQITIQGRNPLRGFTVEKITPTLTQQMDIPFDTKGVVVISSPQKSYGFMSLGLREGDIILSINKTETKNLNRLQDALSKRTRTWNISYKRGNKVFRTVITQ